MRKYFFIASHFISITAFSQSGKIDSLKSLLNIVKEDTTKINLLNKLASEISNSNTQEATRYSETALSLSLKINNPELIANSYHQLALANYWIANYSPALVYNFKALEIRNKLRNKEDISLSLTNIGAIYHSKGDYPNALKYYFNSLETGKELGDKNSVAKRLGNIGLVYYELGDYPNALKRFFEALEIQRKFGDKEGESIDLGNIGNVYMKQGDYINARKYFLESLKISRMLGDKYIVATTLGNIGIVYDDEGDYINALKFYSEALEINKQINDKTGIAINLSNIGMVYSVQKKYKEGEMYLKKSLELCDSIGLLNEKMQIEKFVSKELYFKIQNYQLAYQHYKKYSVSKDSLFNEEKSRDIGRLEQQHEFEVNEIKQKQEFEEKRRQETIVLERRNNLQYSSILLGLAVLFISIFLLSGKFNKNKDHRVYQRNMKWMGAALFISFLIFFEFVLVFFDPIIEKITGSAPAYKLLINAILAGLIFPLHNFLEKKLKSKIIKTEFIEHSLEYNNPFSGTVPLFIGLLSLSILNLSFSNKTDSLKVELEKPIHDTARINIFNELAREYISIQPDSTFLFAGEALKLAQKINWQKGMGNSYHLLGYSYYVRGDYEECLINWDKALQVRKKLTDKKGIAGSLSNIGAVYCDRGDYPSAMKYFFKALELDRRQEDYEGVTADLGNIGNVYNEQGNFPAALKYYLESLGLCRESGDKNRISVQLSNIGVVYLSLRDYVNALKYYNEAMEIMKETGNKFGMATVMANLAIVYKDKGDYPNSTKFFQKVLEVNKEIGNKKGIAETLGNLGVLYADKKDHSNALKYYLSAIFIGREIQDKRTLSIIFGNIGSMNTLLGNFNVAKVYLDSALQLSDSIHLLSIKMNIEKYLSKLYDTTSRWELAYFHYKKYNEIKDSLFNEEKSKDMGRLEQKHETEMTELKRIREEEENKRKREMEINRRNLLQYSGIMLILVFLFLGIFLFARKFRKIRNHKIYEQYIKLMEPVLFISFLILFELILVFLDPYIENITGTAPLYKLIINVLLAGSIFPLHRFLEMKLKEKIIITELYGNKTN